MGKRYTFLIGSLGSMQGNPSGCHSERLWWWEGQAAAAHRALEAENVAHSWPSIHEALGSIPSTRVGKEVNFGM